MSQFSGYDSPLLRREVVPWGVGRDASATLPLHSAIFNDCFVVEPVCAGRDNLSVRSLGALSPFYRSRPTSPTSERDPASWVFPLLPLEDAKHGDFIAEPLTPTTLSSKPVSVHSNQKANCASPRKLVDAGVQTLDVCLRFPKTGLPRHRISKKNRKPKSKSCEIPRDEAEKELLTTRVPAAVMPVADPHLSSKVSKVRSFWNRVHRALPTVFKVSYLCPLRRQSEFLDFSQKHILLEDSSAADLLKTSAVPDDCLSNGASVTSPWADDFEQVNFAE